MVNGRGESHIVVEFSEQVIHIGPPVEAHAVGGDPEAVSDLGMYDSGGNEQHVEAISRREGVGVDEEVIDDPSAVVGEVRAELLDEGCNVQVTKGVHQGIGVFVQVPHNGEGAKTNTRHDGSLRKRRMEWSVCSTIYPSI